MSADPNSRHGEKLSFGFASSPSSKLLETQFIAMLRRGLRPAVILQENGEGRPNEVTDVVTAGAVATKGASSFSIVAENPGVRIRELSADAR